MVRREAPKWEQQSTAWQRRRANFSAVHGGYHQGVSPFPLLTMYGSWLLLTGTLESGSVWVSETMPIYLSVSLSIGLLNYPLVIHLSVRISASLSIHLSLHVFTTHLASICVPTCLSSQESVSCHSAKDCQWVAENTYHKWTIYTCINVHRRGGRVRNWEWQEGSKPTLYWKDISWCWHSWSTHLGSLCSFHSYPYFSRD